MPKLLYHCRGQPGLYNRRADEGSRALQSKASSPKQSPSCSVPVLPPLLSGFTEDPLWGLSFSLTGMLLSPDFAVPLPALPDDCWTDSPSLA